MVCYLTSMSDCVFVLQARSVNVKSRVGSTYQNISSLEVTGTQLQDLISSAGNLFCFWKMTPFCSPPLSAGPILPSTLHTITTLLKPAQKGNFSATLYTHGPTAIMNTHATKDQVRLTDRNLKQVFESLPQQLSLNHHHSQQSCLEES